MKERDLQKLILDWLNSLPRTIAFRRNVGAMTGEYKGKKRFIRFGQPGEADIWGVCAGTHFEVELKVPGRQPTEAQMLWLQLLAKYHAVCFVADSLEGLQEQWPWN